MAAALKRLAELNQRTTSVPIDLVVDELPRFGDGVEREIVAIAQEALTNAVASLARAAASRFARRPCSRWACGCRSPTMAAASRASRRRRGFGMTSMQERAERIGASLTIVTAPRNGTEVVLAWEPTVAADAGPWLA